MGIDKNIYIMLANSSLILSRWDFRLGVFSAIRQLIRKCLEVANKIRPCGNHYMPRPPLNRPMIDNFFGSRRACVFQSGFFFSKFRRRPQAAVGLIVRTVGVNCAEERKKIVRTVRIIAGC